MLTIPLSFTLLGNFGKALCIRSWYQDLILTRKSHNCAGIAFIQGDSAGGSKLIEQTLQGKINFLKLIGSAENKSLTQSPLFKDEVRP